MIVKTLVLKIRLILAKGVWQVDREYLRKAVEERQRKQNMRYGSPHFLQPVPGSQIVRITREWKARKDMSAWSVKKRRWPFLSPVSSRFIFVFVLSNSEPGTGKTFFLWGCLPYCTRGTTFESVNKKGDHYNETATKQYFPVVLFSCCVRWICG